MKFLHYIAFFLLLASCKKEDAITRTETPGAFHSIELNSSFEVYLQEDSTFYIELIGAEEFVNAVQVSVTDSVLTLFTDASNKWTHPEDNKVQVIVHARPLKLVTANETCLVQTVNPITSDEFGLVLKSKSNEAHLDLDCAEFYYWNNFPTGGIVSLHGQVHGLKIWNTAIMTVDARDLIAQYAWVENNAKNDCIVTVTQQISYKIGEQGNIHLYGSPVYVEEEEHTGSGALIKH